MKLSLADITPNRIKFKSHKSHNPSCDIVELIISRDAFITYYIDVNTKSEGMEYYAGENYVVGSALKSNSRHYSPVQIPKKYKQVWNSLREYYNNNFRN